MTPPIVIADSCEITRELLKKTLSDRFPLIIVESPQYALNALNSKNIPCLLFIAADAKKQIKSIYARIHDLHPSLPIIALGTRDNEASAVDAVKNGATGYMIKPLNPMDICAIADKYSAAAAK
jgi:DNA-binding NtrC family response regulator